MVEKIGPYRVYERLGVGGMGEVYKAYDDRLERWVAIKRIRPDREDAEDNRERFKREARATARLNHPSIVHLYGIFQEGESDCIVMEFVDGQSLDRILDGGTLDPLRTATLGHEIASGLAEAHQNGILHRDLKAENIIITPEGRSKILDFGLAKPLLRNELDPVLTDKGQLVGTSRAMSPEYVGGDEIDHRSDLFSLGVLLYECLTAQSPFKAHNTLATLKQVMLHKQTPISEINPDVPQELSGLIENLLEKDPDDRPQSANDVARAFGRLTGRMSSGELERPTGIFSVDRPEGGSAVGKVSGASSTAAIDPEKESKGSFSRWVASDTVLDLRPRRRWMTGLVVLFGLLGGAFFLGSFLFDQETPPEPALLSEGETIRILLGEFENATGEPIYDDGLGQALRLGLEQSRYIQTISPSQLRDALRRMQENTDADIDRELGVEVAQRENADRLVLGRIQRFGKTYSLFVEVVAPQNDVTTFSDSATAERQDEIITTLGDLAAAVRRHLGESTEQVERDSLPLERVTTANFEALRAYSLALRKAAAQEVTDETVTLLKRAIDLDPSFAMAHAKLVAAYSNRGQTELARHHAEAALAHSERLTEPERFYVDGWVARWQGTTEDQIEVWALMSDLHPRSWVAHYNLGLSLWLYRNDFEKAKSVFAKAKENAGTSLEESLAAALLGMAHLALGEWVEAEPLLESAGPVGGDLRFNLRLAQRKYAESEALLAELPSDGSRRSAEARLELDRGNLERAREIYAEATLSLLGESDRPVGLIWFNLAAGWAATAAITGDEESLKAAVDTATQLARDYPSDELYPRSSQPTPVGVSLAVVGRSAARGLGPEVAREIRRILGTPPDHAPPVTRALVEILDGEIALAEGRLDEARRHFDQSQSLVETLLGHDGLAEVELLARERIDGAVEHLLWIQRHRGLALTECGFYCPGPAAQIAAWGLSEYRMGRAAEAAGRAADAAAHYRRFLDFWSVENGSPQARDAYRRLEDLEG